MIRDCASSDANKRLTDVMRILLVNAFRGNERAAKFKDFRVAVEEALNDISNVEYVVRNLRQLRQYIHAQRQQGNVIGDLAMQVARELFDEFDPDGSGAMDSGELVPLLVKLLSFLGTYVSPEHRDRLEFEAYDLVEKFDADGSGELDFEEFIVSNTFLQLLFIHEYLLGSGHAVV